MEDVGILTITWWMWAMIAAVGILLTLCVILKLHELDIYPLREATKIIRQSWFETTLLLLCVGGFIQYGATKGTNGTESAAEPRLTRRSGVQIGDSSGVAADCGDALTITNLCFTGIVPQSDSVRLSVAWPTNMFVEGTTLDFFAKIHTLTNEWTWLDACDTLPYATNADVEISYSVFVTGPSIPTTMFFRVQDRNTCALTMRDSDLDGMPDVYELHNGTNPYVPDAVSVPRLTVGQNGAYASVEEALADSMAYSVVALGGETFVQSKSLVMPSHPVLIEGPDAGYAVIQSDAEIGAIMLTDGQDAQTMFRNLIVDLRAHGNFQAGFWIGGNTPWTGRGAAATFENVRVRANYPGVEHFGWLFYGKGGGPSHLKQCVMNAAGSTWAYGVSSYNAASNVIENCAFLNMPTNGGETVAIAVLSRESTNDVVEALSPADRPDLSWAGYPYDDSYSLTADADGDGISDYDEIFRTNTDPWLADSDGDGISDGDEVDDETDPHNLNSHEYRLIVSVRNADDLPNVTNYVFVASGGDQWSDLVYFCSGEGGETNFSRRIEDGALLVSSFRDFNRNGVFDPNDDIVISNRVSGLQTVANLTFSFGDVDGDGIADIQELADGSDPYDASQFCFNLTLVEKGIFHTTNSLTGEICVGSRTICGPMSLPGRLWEAEVGHVVVSNRDQLVAYFWDDVNANGTRDGNEICVTQQVKIVGHENCLTNTLEMGGFDMDNDGMLDFWENLHNDAGLSPTNAADAYLDYDSDGLINLHEHWSGSDPAVPDGSNTYLSVCARSIDNRLKRVQGTNDVLDIYVDYYQNGTNGVFVRNHDCWMGNLDLSCLSVWNSSCEPHSHGGTAITKKHILWAKHWYLGPGCRLDFVGTNGVVYSRTIDKVRFVSIPGISENDISIASLTEELPDSVVPVRVLGQNAYEKIMSGKYLPVVTINQDKRAFVQEVSNIAFSGDRSCTVTYQRPKSELRAAFSGKIRSGDSGSPTFLVCNGKLVLVGTHWAVGVDSSCPIAIEGILSAVNVLSPGYEMNVENFETDEIGEAGNE